MWEHIRQTGTNPLDVLNADLHDVSPRTGMKFRGAARKNAYAPRVSEKNGQTYVKSNLGEGARYNKNGEYKISQREAARIKAENVAALRLADAKKRRQDAILAEMLAEQAALIAEYDRKRGI